MNGIFYSIGLNPAMYLRGAASVMTANSRIHGSTMNVGASVAKVATAFTAAAAAAGAFLATRGSKLAAEFESTQMAIRTMVGDLELADGLLSQIQRYADTTSFEFPELAQAAKMMLGFEVAAGDVIPQLKKMGDLAAGLSVPIESLVLVYGQARASNTLLGGDMLQLSQKGVNAYSVIAKMLGKTVAETKKLGEQGKLTFPLLQEAFTRLTSEGGTFFRMTEAQGKTTIGRFSTLKDSINAVFRQLGEPINDALRPLMEDISTNYLPKLSAGIAIAIGAIKQAVADGNFTRMLTTPFTAALAYAQDWAAGIGKYLADSVQAGLQWAFNNGTSYATAIGTSLNNIFQASTRLLGASLEAAGFSLAAAAMHGMLDLFNFISALPNRLWSGMKAGVDGFIAALAAGWARILQKLPGMGKAAQEMTVEATALGQRAAKSAAAEVEAAKQFDVLKFTAALDELKKAAQDRAGNALLDFTKAVTDAKNAVTTAGTDYVPPKLQVDMRGDSLMVGLMNAISHYWNIGLTAVEKKKKADEDAAKKLAGTATSADDLAAALKKAKEAAGGGKKKGRHGRGGDDDELYDEDGYRADGRRKVRGYSLAAQGGADAARGRATSQRNKWYGGIGSAGGYGSHGAGGPLDYIYDRSVPAYQHSKTTTQRGKEAHEKNTQLMMLKVMQQVAKNTEGLKVQ